MTQLTVRGFDKELQRRLREFAKQEGISLNRAAVLLMRRGAGLDRASTWAGTVGDALDSFAGSWTSRDEAEFTAAVADFEQVDEELWR